MNQWIALYGATCIALLGSVAASSLVLSRLYWRRYNQEARNRKILLASAWTLLVIASLSLWDAVRLFWRPGYSAWYEVAFWLMWPAGLAILLYSLFQLGDRTGENRNLRAIPPTVLVVEDDAAVVGFLVALLSDAGYNIVAADTPRHALEIFRRGTPAITLLDISLRDGTSGADFLALLRQTPGGLDAHVIIITGDPSSAVGLEQYGIKAADIFEKPLNQALLLQVIRFKTGGVG